MGNGIDTQDDGHHAQHNAQDLHAAFFPAGDGVDDGEHAMENEPACSHVEQDGIVHLGNARDRKADYAQDQAENRKEETLVETVLKESMNDADNTVDKEQHDDAGPGAQVGEQRGGEHGNTADDRQDTHDREQDRRAVASRAGGLADDDCVDAGLDEVEADQEPQADGEYRGMRDGINTQGNFKHTQGNAHEFRDGIVSGIPARDGVDDGQYAVDNEPARGEIEDDEIVHDGRAGYDEADDAQDQAEDREEKLLVVAFFTDPAGDAEDTPDEKQDDDEISCADEVEKRRGQHGDASEDHQDPHNHDHGKRCHCGSS